MAAVVAVPAAAPAHWLKPREIVAGLKQNFILRQRLGVTDVYFDPELTRLLIIKVERQQWEAAPRETRLRLATEWFQLWRHNVDTGIVAVLDASTTESLVNYDAQGRPHLTGNRAAVKAAGTAAPRGRPTPPP